MYNIHNKSTSRYHFDSCSLPSQLTICMRLQFEIILSRSVQQRKWQQWKRGDAFECRKMNEIRFISAIDCVVHFCSILFCSALFGDKYHNVYLEMLELLLPLPLPLL